MTVSTTTAGTPRESHATARSRTRRVPSGTDPPLSVANNGDGKDTVKVVDLEIAKVGTGDGAQRVTRTGLVVGTPACMSPEQLSSDEIDRRSDQYSLAVLFLRMLTGSLPFADAAAAALAPDGFETEPSLPRTEVVASKARSWRGAVGAGGGLALVGAALLVWRTSGGPAVSPAIPAPSPPSSQAAGNAAPPSDSAGQVAPPPGAPSRAIPEPARACRGRGGCPLGQVW
ncbi:MAG: hypothetical protein EXR94_11315 [Gemmatimonadetes bacterium]|nr:hypothetical protein [Gemmatimonadota bacterium]